MKNLKQRVLDSLFLFILSILLGVALLMGVVATFIALGTVEFRSHNTNPKTGVVYTGGIWSRTNEKCNGSNLILDNGYGLAVIANAEVCK